MSVLLAMVFVVALGYGAGLPLLQLYLARYLGDATQEALAWHVGMLGGVYTFALFIFAPWWGRQSDRHGRTVVLVAGFSAFLVGTATAALTPSLWLVYVGRAIAGAGAAAIVPGAQAYVCDISSSDDRNRRFVLIGGAAFLGLLAGPAFGAWLSGPVMGMRAGDMPGMVNWPALAVAALGLPLVFLAPRVLGDVRPPVLGDESVPVRGPRRRFVAVSMVLAMLASFAVGTFEVGFNLFGGQTLGLSSSAIAMMFVTCSVAMLAAQALLMLPSVRKAIDHRWLASVFVASAVALGFTAVAPDAASLGLLIAAVATGVGFIGPVLSYELVEGDRSSAGTLLSRQAAAGNLGQAVGSFGAGALFSLHSLAPFWAAAVILLIGAAVASLFWRVARGAQQPIAHGFDAHAERMHTELPP